MNVPSNFFCYTVLEAVISSEIKPKKITETRHKHAIQCVKHLTEFYLRWIFGLLNCAANWQLCMAHRILFRWAHIM